MTDTPVVVVALELAAYLNQAGAKPDADRLGQFVLDLLAARSERATDALPLLLYAGNILSSLTETTADDLTADELRERIVGALAFVRHAQRGLEAETGIAAEDFAGHPVTRH